MTTQILVISPEALFPTNAGGRAAVLAQCTALRQAGFRIDLLVFHRHPVAPADVDRHGEIAERVVFVRRRSFSSATVARPLSPYQLSSRWLPPSTVRAIEADLPRPQLVVAQQEWTMEAAKRLWPKHALPVLLSSHNDELLYFSDQLRAARGVRRQYLLLERLRLKAALRRLVGQASSVVTLSPQDEGAYASVPVRTIPHPLPDAVSTRRAAPARPTALYIGALDMPHAVDGLLWFVHEVWPAVRRRIPDAVFEVAGRRAPHALRGVLSTSDGVMFHGEVEDIGPLYGRAGVFVNPVFLGSGINIKLADPIGHGIPSVTTSIGARGYEQLADALLLADDAAGFADHCVSVLSDAGTAAATSRVLLERAGQSGKQLVADLWRRAVLDLDPTLA